eukprot:365387-Chlamydomonas_euryale.AAC.1
MSALCPSSLSLASHSDPSSATDRKAHAPPPSASYCTARPSPPSPSATHRRPHCVLPEPPQTVHGVGLRVRHRQPGRRHVRRPGSRICGHGQRAIGAATQCLVWQAARLRQQRRGSRRVRLRGWRPRCTGRHARVMCAAGDRGWREERRRQLVACAAAVTAVHAVAAIADRVVCSVAIILAFLLRVRQG